MNSGSILNFGEVLYIDQAGYIISSKENIPIGPDWVGIYRDFYDCILHFDGKYNGRWWYFVPKEYCELKPNVCWRRLLKDNPNISARPERI